MSQAVERVLVITAHPDDPEFLAGGTVATLVRSGAEVTYVIATNGNKGSSDPRITPDALARLRQDEQRQAAATLGVARVQFLGYEDGEVDDPGVCSGSVVVVGSCLISVRRRRHVERAGTASRRSTRCRRTSGWALDSNRHPHCRWSHSGGMHRLAVAGLSTSAVL